MLRLAPGVQYREISNRLEGKFLGFSLFRRELCKDTWKWINFRFKRTVFSTVATIIFRCSAKCSAQSQLNMFNLAVSAKNDFWFGAQPYNFRHATALTVFVVFLTLNSQIWIHRWIRLGQCICSGDFVVAVPRSAIYDSRNFYPTNQSWFSIVFWI